MTRARKPSPKLVCSCGSKWEGRKYVSSPYINKHREQGYVVSDASGVVKPPKRRVRAWAVIRLDGKLVCAESTKRNAALTAMCMPYQRPTRTVIPCIVEYAPPAAKGRRKP